MELTQQELALKTEELEQFAGSIGKDLSEPLDGILSHVARMKRLAGTDTHAEPHLDEIAASTRRMKDLLEALLLYAASGARHTRRRKVDLNEIMDEVRSGMASLIQQHHVSLRYETLPAVQADRIQMIRLFRSLIEHALRYRSKDMPVIHISASENFERGEYIFAVEDNGTGIDPADYEKIFRLFQKRTGTDGETADLSLAISKKIVDNHGGRLWFTSSSGKGTTFFFSLPHGQLAAAGEDLLIQPEAVEP
jgi:light-regulated signal transduction histidine kinase (bacteriophytochrome)